jgi:hypothetical protein
MIEDPVESAVDQTIDDARAARTESESAAEADGLTGWPEDVLVIRCLAANGVQLTSEQAAKLARWQSPDT